MKNLRLILAGTTAGAALITITAGLLLGAMWATVMGSLSILAIVVLSTFVLIKSSQTVLQRLSGGQKQHERMLQSLWSLQQKIEGQRHVLAQQTSQLNSILNQCSAPKDEPAEQAELRELTSQVLRRLENETVQDDERRRANLTRELAMIFVNDPEVEILDATSEDKK